MDLEKLRAELAALVTRLQQISQGPPFLHETGTPDLQPLLDLQAATGKLCALAVPPATEDRAVYQEFLSRCSALQQAIATEMDRRQTLAVETWRAALAAALTREDWPAAIATAERLLKLNPADAAAAKDKARAVYNRDVVKTITDCITAFERGAYDECVALCESIVGEYGDPKIEAENFIGTASELKAKAEMLREEREGLRQRVQAALAAKRWKQAATEAEQLWRKFSSDTQVMTYRGEALHKLQLRRRGLVFSAITVALILCGIGWVWWQNGERERALARQKKANEILTKAIACFYGTSCTVDEPQAKALFQQAADMELPLAKFWLADNIFCGNCGFLLDTAQGERMARENFEAVSVLAEKNDPNAAFLIGDAYSIGMGVNTNLELATRWFRVSADLGYSPAMVELGKMYVMGRGVPTNYVEAAKWYHKAADLGNVWAINYLGDMYSCGLGVPTNHVEAMTLYRKAANLGHAHAMVGVGRMYADGLSEPTNHVEAVKWYRKAADMGDAGAMILLGLMYVDGCGVMQDQVEAAKWFHKAASQGQGTAMYILGMSYQNGLGVTRDETKALNWYRKAAEFGSPSAMTALGEMYARGGGMTKDEGEAVKWFHKADELGDLRAASDLGVMYEYGRGVPTNNEEAVKYYRKAAARGDISAMISLGAIYENGRGVLTNYIEAVAWYRKAADLGQQQAMVNLGILYANGRGVPVDEAEAIKWFRKAANLGVPLAMGWLGFMNQKGKGVPTNEVEAVRWYRKAADL